MPPLPESVFLHDRGDESDDSLHLLAIGGGWHGLDATGTSFAVAVPGGDERTRTADPLLAKQVLYQLSYVPVLTVGNSVAESGDAKGVRARC
jgi:hypothetical protein